MTDLFNPAVQVSRDGMFTDAFVARFQAVKARHKLATWQIAEAAKFSPAYLANAIRDRCNVSGAFTSRLVAVLEELERANTDEEVKGALNPGAKAAAASSVPPSAASSVAPSMRRDEAVEGGGRCEAAEGRDRSDSTLEHVVAILRRCGISSITLSPIGAGPIGSA